MHDVAVKSEQILQDVESGKAVNPELEEAIQLYALSIGVRYKVARKRLAAELKAN